KDERIRYDWDSHSSSRRDTRGSHAPLGALNHGAERLASRCLIGIFQMEYSAQQTMGLLRFKRNCRGGEDGNISQYLSDTLHRLGQIAAPLRGPRHCGPHRKNSQADSLGGASPALHEAPAFLLKK